MLEEMQNEIMGYQQQMDIYAKVLKSMEAKMARIDSKAKLIAKTPLNETVSTNDADNDEKELLSKLRNIRSKFDATLMSEDTTLS